MNSTIDSARPRVRRAVELDSGSWRDCEAAIRRFEAAWQSGPPEISAYLPLEEPLRSAVLLELVQIDLEFRRKRGEAARFETYLPQFPELARFPNLPEFEQPTAGPDAETRRGSGFAAPLGESLPQLPGFEMLRELGRGGMGVVFLARQTALKRLVAVKMIRGGSRPAEELARFRGEIEAAARLKHQHIVQIYEVGEHAGQPYCVLEYVDGGNLQQKLAGQPQPADVAARIIQQLALAVQHAHEAGIVHRDLKPANVLIEAGGRESGVGSRQGKDPTPDPRLPTPALKIADFGLARHLEAESQQTRTGEIVGTPAYMSPEQAEGASRECGPATDIYALGVILYELLTGRPPFQGASLLDTLEQVRSQEPVPPRALAPRTPRDLNTICLKCLQKEPARRYPTAAALAADLAALADGRPISARAIGPLERAWKAARRRPLVATLAAAVVVIAAAGLSYGIYQYGQTRAALAATATALENEKAERTAKEDALKDARESLADFKAFSTFVVEDIVNAARPEGKDGGLGIDATVREALDAATANLAKRFAGQPRAEALARLDLGETYRALGEPAKALAHFQEAVRVRRQVLGPNHSATMQAEDRLGSALRQTGKTGAAIQLHEELLARCQRVKGADSQSALAVEFSLVQDYQADGQPAEALRRSEHLVQRSLAVFGTEHESTLKVQHQRGTLLSQAGQWRQALPILEQVVAARTKLYGPHDPLTLGSLANLASIYRKQGRRADARKQFEDNLEQISARLGPQHPRTLTAKTGIAQMLAEEGRFQDAIDMASAAHQTAAAKIGPAHPDTLEIAAALAEIYESAGRVADALSIAEETYRLRKETLGLEHPSTLQAQSNLASAFRLSGREGDAVRLTEESLAGLRKKLPPNHPKIVWALNNLGLAYKEAGQPEKALPLYQDVVQSLTERYGPASANTLTARNNLGGALMNLNRVGDAIDLCEETLAICDEKLGADDQTTLIVVHNLGTLYHAADRSQDAERLFRRAFEGRQLRLGPNNADTLQSLYRLAGIYLLRKDLAQAEPLLLDCHQRLKASPQAPADLVKNVETALAVLAKVKADPTLTPKRK